MRDAVIQELRARHVKNLKTHIHDAADSDAVQQSISELFAKNQKNIQHFEEPSECYDEILNALNSKIINPADQYKLEDLYTTTVNEMFRVLLMEHNQRTSDDNNFNTSEDSSNSQSLDDEPTFDQICLDLFHKPGNLEKQTKLYNLTWLGRLSLAIKHRSGQPIDDALTELVWEDGKISFEQTNQKYSVDDLQNEDINCQKAIYNILCRKLEKKTLSPNCVNHCLIAAGLSIAATSGVLLMLTSTSLTNIAICSSIMGIVVGVSKYNWDTYKVVSYNINHPFKSLWFGSQVPADAETHSI